MLSRSEFQGKLSYEEYVNRFKSRQARHLQRLKEQLPTNTNDLNKQITEKKKTITDGIKEKAKEQFKKAIQNQTGINTDEVSDAYDAVKGGVPESLYDKRKKNEIITGIAINRAIIPNTTELSKAEQDRAKLSNASKIAYLNDDNFRTAQEYMDKHNLGTIDTELSNGSSIVVERPTGEHEIHFRGTAVSNKPNYQDFITDASIITGTEQGINTGIKDIQSPAQIQEAEQQLQRAMTKYGKIEHLGGYSRGGGIALHLGNKYNIETTTFNPLVGPKAIAGSHSTTVNHTLIRTTEDPTTIGLAIGSPNSDNWKVKAIKPLEKYSSNIPLKNVYDSHRLDNFTEDSPRKIGEAEITKAHYRQVDASRKQLERVMLGDMRDSISNGDSFTDYMSKFNPGDSQTTPNGKRLSGTRMYGNDPYTEGWYKLGGRFTKGEAEFINDVRENGENASPHTEPITQKKSQNFMAFDDEMVGGRGEDIMQGLVESEPRTTQEQFETARAKAEETKQAKKNSPIGEEEKALINNLNNSDSKFKLSDSDIKNYKEGVSSDEALAAELTAAEQEHFDSIQAHDDIASAHVEHSGNSDAWRSANATNLAVGYGIGSAVQKLAGLIPGEKEFEEDSTAGRVIADISKGSATGIASAQASVALGSAAEAALLPEAVGGAAGFVAGDFAAEQSSKLTKKLGGTKNTQELVGDTAGGAAGGGVGALATIGTAAAADALLGTEYGSILGPEGAAAGALLGAGIGLGSAVYHQGIKGVGNDFEEIGKGAVSGIENIGKSIASWF